MNNLTPNQPSRATPTRSEWPDYVLAVTAVSVATLIRLALDPALGDNYPFVTYFVAVAVVAWFGRTPSAVFTLVASGLLTFYLFVPPRFSFAPTDPGVLLGLGLFLMVAGVIVAMSHAMRMARRRAEHLLAEAVIRQAELRRSVVAESEQRERLRTTLASIGEAVISTDAAGNIKYLNPVAESLTGWTNDAARNVPLTTVFRIVHGSTRLPVENPVLRALEKGEIVKLANHTILIAQDGTERLIDDSAAPIRGKDGEIVGCVLVFRDIGDRRQLERIQQEAQGRLVATLESITDAFARFDHAWRFDYVNAEAERLTGRSRSTLLGKNHWEVFPTALGTIVEKEYRRAVAHQVTVEFEHHFGPLGRWFAIKGDPTPDGGLAVFFRDITEEKLQREAVAASEARFHELADAMPQIVYVTDSTGKIEFINRQWLEYTGQPNAQTADLTPVVHPDDLPGMLQRWQQAATAGMALESEFRLRRAADGEFRWFLTRSVPGRDASGRIVKWYGTSTDIHDQKRVEQEIARLAARSDRQRRLYETVLNNTPDLAYVFDLNHRFTYANHALLKMWGRSWDDAIGKNCRELGYEPWHADLHDREIDQVIVTKQPIRGEVAFTGMYGRRQYDYIFVPVLGADGEVEAVAGTTRDVTDRQEAERTLRASEERLRIALTAARMVAWEWTPADGKLSVSENAVEVFGLPAGVGLTRINQGLALLHPDDVATYQATFQKAIDDRASYLLRYRLIRPDNGRVIVLEERGNAVADRPEGGVRLYGVATDVTERQQAEDRLRASEERFRSLFETMDEGFCVVDMVFDETGRATDYRIAEMNPAFERHTGLQNILGKSVREAVPGLDEFWFEAYGRVARTGEPARFVHDAEAMGGRWFDVSAFRLGTEGSNKVAILFKDITDRRRAEELLRQSESRFKVTLKNSKIIVYTTDKNLRYTWIQNPDPALNPELVLGRRDDELFTPAQAYPLVSIKQDVLQSGMGKRCEYLFEQEGNRFIYDLTVEPLRGVDGEVIGLTVAAMDITDRKRAEEALREADRRKDEFLATLAHELRNPLAPIRNGLQVIRLSTSNETVEQARTMMERQLTQLVRLVDDLLDVSRITRGKLELRTERVDLRDVIDSAIETSRPTIEQSGHHLSVVLPKKPMFLDGDHTRLAQVVSNLLNNSAKYTHPGGHISLTVECVNSMAVVSVKDNGIGIPPTMISRVFEMFIQVDRTLEKTTGGLGIGLSLVKGLVEMHRGTIEAKSEGEGRGSEFIVRLPILAIASDPDLPDTPSATAEPSTLRRILVVDDNVDAADSLGQLLRMLGNDVRTANDGETGIETAKAFQPDVVLMDIGMPKVNGYEACHRIRLQPWGKDMVLVALTGWGQEEDRRKSAAAGFNFHLVKPVEPATLVKLLAEQKKGSG